MEDNHGEEPKVEITNESVGKTLMIASALALLAVSVIFKRGGMDEKWFFFSFGLCLCAFIAGLIMLVMIRLVMKRINSGEDEADPESDIIIINRRKYEDIMKKVSDLENQVKNLKDKNRDQ